MSYMFRLSNEQYEKLAAYAEQKEQTPEELFLAWVDEVVYQLDTAHTAETEQEMSEEELRAKHPLLKIEGILSIGEPGWADRHDEYFAGAYVDEHTKK